MDLYVNTEAVLPDKKILSERKNKKDKDAYGFLVNFSPTQFDQGDLGPGLTMKMDGVSFFFVEDGQEKFDEMIVQEYKMKDDINMGRILSKKVKDTQKVEFNA